MLEVTEPARLGWLRQHECVEKLNMHAILSASAGQEQLLIELLISHAKVSTGGG